MARRTTIDLTGVDGGDDDDAKRSAKKKRVKPTTMTTLVLPEPTRKVFFHSAPKGYPCFMSNEPKTVRYAGITDQLPLMFYPTYRFERATFGPETTETRGQKPASDRGQKFGTKIENQLRDIINFMSENKLTISALLSHLSWFEAKKAKNKSRKAKGEKAKRAKPNPLRAAIRKLKMHKYTKRILERFVKEGWHPVYAQLPVVCVDGRAATAVDIVAVHTTTKVIWLIELKMNYDGVYFKHTNNAMNAPFQKLSDAPINQHFIQVLATMGFFRATYPKLCKERVVRSVIIRAHNARVEPHHLPAELTSNHAVSVALWKKLCRIADSRVCVLPPERCGCTCCSFHILLKSCPYIDL